MSEKKRGLGRGLGALIPASEENTSATDQDDSFHVKHDDIDVSTLDRPIDLLFGGGRKRNKANKAVDADKSVKKSEFDEKSEGDLHRSKKTEDLKLTDSQSELQSIPGLSLTEVKLDDIRPNPKQPRQVFDEDELAELAESIREVGLLQPIVVRQLAAVGSESDPHYELIMGERRWRASQRATLKTIPALVKSTNDDDLLRDALLENLHRSQLNPLEEAAAYQQLLEDFGITHDQLAERIKRSRPKITNSIRLLKLPGSVQNKVAAGVLSAGHARALLGLLNPQEIEDLAKRIIAEGLSVRATEEIVMLGKNAHKGSLTKRKTRRAPLEIFKDYSDQLSTKLDTTVKITSGQKKGKISIEFASADDLKRIIDILN